MPTGTSIRIYLSDGTASGLRLAEIVNRTVQALACPRSRFNELNTWTEIQKPGVYFLLARGDAGEPDRVYIGEAEHVHDRLADHIKNKEFWNEVIAFTSKDTNLTKGHVKYLESQLYSLAKAAGRYSIENSNTPTPSSLPRGDVDAMEEIIMMIRTLLGTLGHRLLDPIIPPSSVQQTMIPKESSFTFKFMQLTAYGVQSDEGFIVHTNSDVSRDTKDSLSPHIKYLRQQAFEDGTVVAHGQHFKLAKDYLFASASTAAGFVAGTNRNGRDAWKTAQGVTLKSIEEALAQQVTSSIS